MDQKTRSILVGGNSLQQFSQDVSGKFVSFSGETFYKISNYDSIPPFFMSLVSSSNHWFFIASTGGLSVGRDNASLALFPYYTVDKITENYENTGPRTIFLVEQGGKTCLWEPFSNRYRGIYFVEHNLYKNTLGTTLIFEEINHTLRLTYRYAWRMGDLFGFVKSNWLINDGPEFLKIEVVDGLQNILPANVPDSMQTNTSVLVDAYKRNELDPSTGMGFFTLNSIPTDLAEPRESLLASVAWQTGLIAKAYLLSSRQLDCFRAGEKLTTEAEVRGLRGAYFVNSTFELASNSEHSWHIASDVQQDAASIIHLQNLLKGDPDELLTLLETDLASNRKSLENIVACADGIQVSQNMLLTSHHFANTMFNVMRGGYFPDNYSAQKGDFLNFIGAHDRSLLTELAAFFSELPENFSIGLLNQLAERNGSKDLLRLANSFLPLSFSRRHGDPSRPWNRFSINLKKTDGSLQLDYEGNWRDIFQNWEALAYSYPEYIENMIFTFLNATTMDGYNPYRITYRGIDWEVPEPANPWANIGYWSDHQIIYLVKLMEISSKVHPGRLSNALDRSLFSYANIPYRIKPYEELIKDPFNTIFFDWDLEREIEEAVRKKGTDQKLVQSQKGKVLHATLAEKLLTLLMAKLANFVPEGGIWMNTQRPEWNDANNALVGKGLSVVTLAYLRRFIVFISGIVEQSAFPSFDIHSEVQGYYSQVKKILEENKSTLQSGFSEDSRRKIMDDLGQAGSNYRWNSYQNSFSGQLTQLTKDELINFLDLVLKYCDRTLRVNRREDHLFHAYNILHLEPGVARVSHMYEMLEGQVAILSSGFLNGAESLTLLESLRNGPLFRVDQRSYILYPDRVVKSFIERNTLESNQVKEIPLVKELIQMGNDSLFVQDETGKYHFAGAIHNIKDVRSILNNLKRIPNLSDRVEKDAPKIEKLFEQTFHHDQFTGRSGTFFAYEGLGSIYWHMVSKYLLAVQETILRTRNEASISKLLEFYTDIRAGQCFNKSPVEYGAFPTDPYSHTPAGQGAKQPGMTGMVKEEILARQAELGLNISEGRLCFDLLLFNRKEFLQLPAVFTSIDVNECPLRIDLPAGSLAYSICQVPVILKASLHESIQVHKTDGTVQNLTGHWLDTTNSRHIFERDGTVHHLEVNVPTLSL
jgi:hypothetical protein